MGQSPEQKRGISRRSAVRLLFLASTVPAFLGGGIEGPPAPEPDADAEKRAQFARFTQYLNTYTTVAPELPSATSNVLRNQFDGETFTYNEQYKLFLPAATSSGAPYDYVGTPLSYLQENYQPALSVSASTNENHYANPAGVWTQIQALYDREGNLVSPLHGDRWFSISPEGPFPNVTLLSADESKARASRFLSPQIGIDQNNWVEEPAIGGEQQVFYKYTNSGMHSNGKKVAVQSYNTGHIILHIAKPKNV